MVKNVTFSRRTSPCTEVFSLCPRICRKRRRCTTRLQKQRNSNHRNGRVRPYFFGFQPPKGS